jgi:molybdopterin synthase sulfur carrier subunit
MTTVAIQLFGALREAEPDALLRLESAATDIRQLRAEVDAIAAARWPAQARALLQRSAFSSATTILRDADALPSDGVLALLPPVSGG